MRKMTAVLVVALLAPMVWGREIHVSVNGNDGNSGTVAQPVKSISAAAQRARPGDIVTVHEGVYREYINPPRGGESDDRRIVYRANPGDKVVVKGSEVVKGWEKVQNDTWKVSIPNEFFGDFNPYNDLIRGDWFNGKGRNHHTGAVYLNGHWMIEAKALEDVLAPAGSGSLGVTGDCLLNVAWLKVGEKRIPAVGFGAQNGTQSAACSEGGECLGWIEHGDWIRYDNVDLGDGTEHIIIRAASETQGGIIEVRLDSPTGKRLGSCTVPNTGGWQVWSSFDVTIPKTTGTRNLCLAFRGLPSALSSTPLWFGKVDDTHTTIWAQFPQVNPNETEVEINVRQSVFYPKEPGINYITVRGFTMLHAATPWSPPTAEQIGLIGTHWSKGWIIEDNDIRYSTCVGVTLGKHGDEFDNTSQNTAEGYVKTIERGLARGWSRENIGHHIVRNNHISDCEQAGIVGSLGAAFCTVTGNVIHEIHMRQLFTGAEMAGIKFHAAIDTEISRNHIYRCVQGIWLDWMTQGTHITRNVLHDNNTWQDLFVEVNHGPFLADHNLFLSRTSLLDVSEGGAYVHNLFTGRLNPHPEPNRDTPYHPAHSTEVAGLIKTLGGDNRFINNLFVGNSGLNPYDNAARPMRMNGNVFLKGATPSKNEKDALVLAEFDPEIILTEQQGNITLNITLDRTWARKQMHDIVTTETLGKAAVSDVPYVQADDTPYRLDRDYFDKPRPEHPYPGPFEITKSGRLTLKVWPSR